MCSLHVSFTVAFTMYFQSFIKSSRCDQIHVKIKAIKSFTLTKDLILKGAEHL